MLAFLLAGGLLASPPSTVGADWWLTAKALVLPFAGLALELEPRWTVDDGGDFGEIHATITVDNHDVTLLAREIPRDCQTAEQNFRIESSGHQDRETVVQWAGHDLKATVAIARREDEIEPSPLTETQRSLLSRPGHTFGAILFPVDPTWLSARLFVDPFPFIPRGELLSTTIRRGSYVARLRIRAKEGQVQSRVLAQVLNRLRPLKVEEQSAAERWLLETSATTLEGRDAWFRNGRFGIRTRAGRTVIWRQPPGWRVQSASVGLGVLDALHLGGGQGLHIQFLEDDSKSHETKWVDGPAIRTFSAQGWRVSVGKSAHEGFAAAWLVASGGDLHVTAWWFGGLDLPPALVPALKSFGIDLAAR